MTGTNGTASPYAIPKYRRREVRCGPSLATSPHRLNQSDRESCGMQLWFYRRDEESSEMSLSDPTLRTEIEMMWTKTTNLSRRRTRHYWVTRDELGLASSALFTFSGSCQVRHGLRPIREPDEECSNAASRIYLAAWQRSSLRSPPYSDDLTVST